MKTKSLLLSNVLLNGVITDIAIEGNRIANIAQNITGEFQQRIDATGLAALPPFYNTHGHSAMTLLRGYADDLELFDWLNNHIWPAEAKLTGEDVYWGARLACLEMIRTGTVFVNDMYDFPNYTLQAVEDSGMRGAIGMLTLLNDPQGDNPLARKSHALYDNRDKYSSRIQLTWAPHAIYTVKEEYLRFVAKDAAEKNLRIHIHLAETAQEVADCIKEHGCTPVEYLDKVGVLGEGTIAAHSIHLSDTDINLLRERRVTLSHMPVSNYKLVSGQFQFDKLMEAGVRVTIGTDGCASNNNLSMLDEMKMAALNAKMQSGKPTAGTVSQIFNAATRQGAQAFGIDAGVIEKGRLADLMLVDLNNTLLTADHNLLSNMVYSADSSCIDTVICDGRILMQHHVIPGMNEIIDRARDCARRLR